MSDGPYCLPFMWSLIGLWAAISLGMIEDLGLIVGGLIAARAILRYSRVDYSGAQTRLRFALCFAWQAVAGALMRLFATLQVRWKKGDALLIKIF